MRKPSPEVPTGAGTADQEAAEASETSQPSTLKGPPDTLNLKGVVEPATREAERETILRALELTRWNRRKAARLLGISYKTLLQKIRMCNLEG